jgi:hypothetical protein
MRSGLSSASELTSPSWQATPIWMTTGSPLGRGDP